MRSLFEGLPYRPWPSPLGHANDVSEMSLYERVLHVGVQMVGD
jgi:hypothetical protein